MLQLNALKYKLMTKEELFRSLDRLTRFKHPKFKYRRVFYDIIFNNLISPKYSLKKLADLDDKLISEIVEIIWNNSVENLLKENHICKNDDDKIAHILRDEAKTLYLLDNQSGEFFNTKLNISDLLKLKSDNENLPINLSRLHALLNNNLSTKKLRETKNLKFPLEKVVLCEGITEEILLPVFANLLDFNFDKYGIHLISAGGKNQVARWYVDNKDLIKIPIFILLDNDAKEVHDSISAILHEKDKIYIIKNGEFEDIIPKKLIKKAINDSYKNEFEIKMDDLKTKSSMCSILSEIMRIHRCGNFKKADFAKCVRNVISSKTAVSEEISEIVAQIKTL